MTGYSDWAILVTLNNNNTTTTCLMTFYPVWLTAASTRKTSVHSQQPLWLLHNTFNNALHSCWAWQHFTAISLFSQFSLAYPPRFTPFMLIPSNEYNIVTQIFSTLLRWQLQWKTNQTLSRNTTAMHAESPAISICDHTMNGKDAAQLVSCSSRSVRPRLPSWYSTTSRPHTANNWCAGLSNCNINSM